MRRLLAVLLVGLIVGCATSYSVPELAPYPLPPAVQESLVELADECHVLVFGEMHGTREVPAIVVALADQLSKARYGVIALEIPHDEQPAIEAWATGRTDAMPRFFSHPMPDGRGNREVLAMLRQLLRPPRAWKLVCFDGSQADMLQQLKDRLPEKATGSLADAAAQLSPEDIIALGNERDALMAQLLAAEMNNLKPPVKVLAICGNLHARTANRVPSDDPFAKLWPSFAAALMQNETIDQVRSINVSAFGGEFFNEGKVQQLPKRELQQAEFRRTPNSQWGAELNIPKATVATFF